jgi:hypothetical protein
MRNRPFLCSTFLVFVIVALSSSSRVGASVDSVTVTPEAMGTIRHLPELEILEIAPVGTMVQSTYFKTTELNREFRRGFIEFLLPEIGGQILSARLIIKEWRAIIEPPVPPVTHELSFYSPADLTIDVEDFDRPTVFITSFDTDENLPPQTFGFDVTGEIVSLQENTVGFRIKLAVDPWYDEFGSFGSGFGSLGWIYQPRLEIIAGEPTPVSRTTVGRIKALYR